MTCVALTLLVGHKVTSTTEVVIKNYSSSATNICTGTIVKAKLAHSISSGTVVEVCKDFNDLWCVTVQYNIDMLFRYCGLTTVYAYKQQQIKGGDIVGIPYHNQVRFEWCTRHPTSNLYRLDSKTYYKNDPATVLMDKLIITSIEPNAIIVGEAGE